MTEEYIYNQNLNRLILLQDKIQIRKFIDHLIDNLLELQSQIQRSHYVYF